MIEKQPRVAHGRNAQLAVKKHLPPEATLLSVARPGSKRPDIVAILDGVLFQIEVKSCDSLCSAFVPLSCTIRKTSSTFIDSLIPLFTDDAHSNMHEVIQHHRRVDDTIGFPCDFGTGRSGKIPQTLVLSDDHQNLELIHDHVISHFHKGGNTYLALVCKKPTPSIHLYYTGFGPNVMNAPDLPMIATAKLNTYGTAPLDALRVALRITLPPVPGLIISN